MRTILLLLVVMLISVGCGDTPDGRQRAGDLPTVLVGRWYQDNYDFDMSFVTLPGNSESYDSESYYTFSQPNQFTHTINFTINGKLVVQVITYRINRITPKFMDIEIVALKEREIVYNGRNIMDQWYAIGRQSTRYYTIEGNFLWMLPVQGSPQLTDEDIQMIKELTPWERVS